jgi:hypothetical protein
MTANIEYIHAPELLAAALEENAVDIAFIQQANPVVRYLGDIDGYHLHRVGITTEAHDLAMLVHRGHKVTEQKAIRVPGSRWTGPIHGNRHGRKVFHAALIDDLFWAVNIHLPTQRPTTNANARYASFDRLAQFADHRAGRPIVMGGDWNTSVHGLEPFASRIDGHVAGSGIDNFVYRGAHHFDTNDRIPRPGGTHGWVIADFAVSAA